MEGDVAQSPAPSPATPNPPSVQVRVGLKDDWPGYFSHIFDREAQIRVIMDSVRSAFDSDWRRRNHCLLYGNPACGKTEVLLAVERMLGPAIALKLDATSLTKAGAENLLLEMEAVPPVLILEELEKCNPANLPWLLGVMDQRGEIIKTNARIGVRRREARCLCLATVNDLSLFTSIMSGALASRFQHKVYCPRPSRAILEKILRREVQANGGKEEWIAPALHFVCHVEGTNDPRRAISVLDGGDRLLTGEYQADWKQIHEAKKREQHEKQSGP